MNPVSKRPFALWLAPAIFLLLGLAQQSLADGLEAQVDRNNISEQDTLTLTLRYTGQTQDSPNFDPLLDDFDILSRRSSNQMRVINNRMESWTEWQLILYPRRSGELRIPALTLGDQHSQPIRIRVEPASRGDQAPDRDFYAEVEVDNDTPYVQQQVLLTVRLITRVSLNHVEIEPPTLDNALVMPLGENRFHREIDNVAHGVIEYHYAIFPQRSGELTLPSQTLDLQVGRGQRDIWGNLYGSRSGLQRLRTEELTLQVRPVPPGFAGNHWLPAANLELEERWSGDLDNLTVGEPVTRTITLRAQGLTLGQLPPLELTMPEGITSYPDQPQTDEQRGEDGARSVRIETLAMVPNRRGNLKVPEVQVHWWDTGSDQPRTATLPARTLRVSEPVGAAADRDDSPTRRPLTTELPAGEPPQAQSLPLWWLLGYLPLILLLALLAVGYWRQRAELAAISELYLEEQSENRRREGHSWKDIKQASKNQDLAGLRLALIGWAQVHWDNPRLHSLEDLAAQTDDPQLHEQLRALDRALYGGDPASVDLEALLRAINKLREQKRRRVERADSLKPLYRYS